MVEQLVSRSIHALLVMNKTVPSAIQPASLVIMVSDQYAGAIAHLVGLILAHSVRSGQTLREKAAVVPSSVAAAVVLMDTLILVALATEVHKPELRTPMVVELEFLWFVALLRISMEAFVIQNAKQVTPGSVQYAGRIVLEIPLMLEQHAPRSHMVEPLESQ